MDGLTVSGASSLMKQAQHQVVVFGATSSSDRFSAGICWIVTVWMEGFAGPSLDVPQSKLSRLRGEFGARAERLPVMIADSADEEALRQLCGSTSVVISTVGPYALYGSLLVKVCVETGTDSAT